jgi:transposase InsO family protein
MGRFLIETHLRTGRPIKELAAAHDVSARWLFKLLRRYRLEGAAGLEPRSRRPKTSPTRIADLYEDEIVALHKALADDGLDAGAATIHFHLAQRSTRPPSVSTIFRVLKARGFVTLSPKKRPKSSIKRFVADLPNETWQADMTHVEFGGGQVYEVLNMIDDHSRLCVASRAMKVVKANDVVRVLHKAAESWGYPASFLSDNGLIFSTQRHHQVAGVTEQELFALGIEAKHARPYHPQTWWKGRALPPDHEEVLGHAGHQQPQATPAPARSLRRVLQRGATAPGHRAQDTGSGLPRPGEGRAFSVIRQGGREEAAL